MGILAPFAPPVAASYPAMSDDEGLRVVLSPLQLSAMLLGEKIDAHEIAMNRFWGAVKVVGGVLEMVGGSALLVTPDPTMVTKVGGVVLAAHGIDDASSGLWELWTGQPDKTLTQRAGEGIAYTLGANKAQAERTGIVLEVAVPLAVVGIVGAVRVMSIRAGRIALAEHEAMGGHTILKHVGRREAQLRARLAAEHVPGATSFYSLRVAENTLSEALKSQAPIIKAWASSAARPDRFRFVYTAGKMVGHGVMRNAGALQQMQRVQIVLKATQVNGNLYFILTAFPIP